MQNPGVLCQDECKTLQYIPYDEQEKDTVVDFYKIFKGSFNKIK